LNSSGGDNGLKVRIFYGIFVFYIQSQCILATKYKYSRNFERVGHLGAKLWL